MNKLTSLVIPLLLLVGCSNAKKQEPENHNYHEIRNNLIDWVDVFNQLEHDYIVYFYSERCGHCNSNKNDIISYYLTTDNKMYFVCTDLDAIFGSQKDLRGIDNIDDFYIFGTPFLIRLQEYVVSEYYAGTNAILNYIKH